MSDSTAASRGGLEGVVAADSAIGLIDGEVGELRYSGYLIKDLAEHASFSEVLWLLWHGELPTSSQRAGLRDELRRERRLPGSVEEVLRVVAAAQDPMAALRTVVSACSVDDDGAPATDREANLRRGVRMSARIPTIVAAYHRLRSGAEPVAPRDDLGHAGNFLYMLTGEEPSADVERMFDTCLVLHAEHGFNASTFAARVTAGTLSDMYAAITSAIGTLAGPLHGGANTAVMGMLLEIGDPERAEAHLDGLLARREKVMGFGHRVYKVVDPRALILKDFSRRLAEQGESRWYEISRRLEDAMKSRKGIDVNVDFYSASTYYSMGIPPDLFTCVFAVSRIGGWVAHFLEQTTNNRLIRPRANWVGPAAREWVSIEQRG